MLTLAKFKLTFFEHLWDTLDVPDAYFLYHCRNSF